MSPDVTHSLRVAFLLYCREGFPFLGILYRMSGMGKLVDGWGPRRGGGGGVVVEEGQ